MSDATNYNTGKSESGKATLTEKEFCERVGISRMTAYRLREAGKLSYCRVGDKVLYLPRHVDEFLSNCEQRTRTRGGE
jgi:excisionase family DNA binding protein